jgi:hypothetical protein
MHVVIQAPGIELKEDLKIINEGDSHVVIQGKLKEINVPGRLVVNHLLFPDNQFSLDVRLPRR